MKREREPGLEFRIALWRKFGSQSAASRAIGIQYGNLSMIKTGKRVPTRPELQKLKQHFSDGQLKRFGIPTEV